MVQLLLVFLNMFQNHTYLWLILVLKMDHARVIDTSLVFKYNYDGTRRPLRLKRPSLNHLCKVKPVKAQSSAHEILNSVHGFWPEYPVVCFI